MEDVVNYPTWGDVGIPKSFVHYILDIKTPNLVNYLISNRVFRFHVKPCYIFRCNECNHKRKSMRSHEDYSKCERCNSSLIVSEPFWRMGKDNVLPYSQREDLLPNLIHQMSQNHYKYFGVYPPEDFLQTEWRLDRAAERTSTSDQVWNFQNPTNIPISPQDRLPIFVAQFAGGEQVRSFTQLSAICWAAVLCPFLWDDCYDWKYNFRKGRYRETHILPLLNIMKQLGRSNHKGSEFRHLLAKDHLLAKELFEAFGPGEHNIAMANGPVGPVDPAMYHQMLPPNPGENQGGAEIMEFEL